MRPYTVRVHRNESPNRECPNNPCRNSYSQSEGLERRLKFQSDRTAMTRNVPVAARTFPSPGPQVPPQTSKGIQPKKNEGVPSGQGLAVRSQKGSLEARERPLETDDIKRRLQISSLINLT